MLFYLEHAIQDATLTRSGERRVVSKRMLYVETEQATLRGIFNMLLTWTIGHYVPANPTLQALSRARSVPGYAAILSRKRSPTRSPT
jgi:hypothetical protein